jgi:hypothetical protein
MALPVALASPALSRPCAIIVGYIVVFRSPSVIISLAGHVHGLYRKEVTSMA